MDRRFGREKKKYASFKARSEPFVPGAVDLFCAPFEGVAPEINRNDISGDHFDRFDGASFIHDSIFLY